MVDQEQDFEIEVLEEQRNEVVESLLFGQDVFLDTSIIFIIQLSILLLFSMMILGFAIKKLIQLFKG